MFGGIYTISTCLRILKVVHFNGPSSERFSAPYRSSSVNIPHLLLILASYLVHVEVKCMQPVAMNERNFISK